MLRVLVGRGWPGQDVSRVGVGPGTCWAIRTKRKGRIMKKMAALAKKELNKNTSGPFAGLGKVSAATRESVERNLELAKLAKTNLTNLEAIQSRIDRRAARAARKAEKRKKSRKEIDIAGIKAERERQRALKFDQVLYYPEDKEVQELIVRRFLKLQNCRCEDIYKDPTASVFDWSNIKQPYFIGMPNLEGKKVIMERIGRIHAFAMQHSKEEQPREVIMKELAFMDNHSGDTKNRDWWMSVCCAPELQYDCFNDYVLNVYLKFGIVKDFFLNKKAYYEKLVGEYHKKLIDSAMFTGVLELSKLVSWDVLDTIQEASQNDPRDRDYIWTIHEGYYLRVHKALMDVNPAFEKKDLDLPPKKLHPKVEFILRSSKTVWDGQKWVLPTIQPDLVQLYKKLYVEHGYEWPQTENGYRLPLKEHAHHANFNFRMWRQLMANDPERLENYREHLKRVTERCTIPRRNMSKLFKRVLLRVAGNFAGQFANGTVDDALFLCKHSERMRRMVINSLKKEFCKYPDVFKAYICRKIRVPNQKGKKPQGGAKKQARDRDHPLDDFFVDKLKEKKQSLPSN